MTRKAARHDADAGEAPGDVLELVTLDVARIHPYEHNPRRAPNTEYDRIKASIRADGLSQPLVVTQRPGETDYIVHACSRSIRTVSRIGHPNPSLVLWNHW